MKIVERLVKEGSSADEPLNIQLSDYSSDEGDTSSSSDNEGKAGNYSDYEGPCCQPLKVPPCSPVLTVIPRKEEKKTRKKSKSKSSNHHKRNRKIHRTALELPTTDPGSDLQFSTDDEAYIEMDGYGTIPRTHRTHLQNELQRRLQSEVQQTDQQMPPELIVTPAKHKSIESLVLRLEDDKPKKSSPAGQLEFPPITGTTRRTNSWHNLNKCGQKIRLANSNYMETTENLQIKLSLKKQIWTGVMAGVTYGDKNVPLSWGVPPVIKKKTLQIIKDDSEALLNACSQKLAAWQQNELNKCRDDDGNSLESGYGKGKMTINLVVPEMNEKQQQYLGRKSACSSNKTPTKLEQQQSALNEPPKHKKRRNPLSRIEETTQILSRLAKSKVKASTGHKKSLSNSILSTTNTGISIIPPLAPLTKTHHNKFKTGGLVATAVQPIKKKKIRLMASNTAITTTMTTKNQENFVGETDADKPLKKVKSKTKRRKSKVTS